MTEGPRNMLGVFITLLYTYTMPNNPYSCKPTSLRCHLMAKHCLEVGRNRKSEARNLPTCGCKSMTEGPRNMLGVFITLLYTYTMPNNPYSCKPTSLSRCHLMAKHCLEVGRNRKSEASNLPTCGCKSMTEGPRNMLGVFITLLYTYTMPNNPYSCKPTSLRCHLMAKHCLESVGRNRKSEARNLPTCGCKSMTEGPRNMLGVFITLLYTYTMPNNPYSCKPTSLRCHLMAKHCLEVGRNRKSEARNLPTCGCKSMTDGPRNMLGVFLTLLYTYTMPNNPYSCKPTSLRCHLMAKHCLEVGRNRKSEARSKSANMWL